jgi:hypothetical protein
MLERFIGWIVSNLAARLYDPLYGGMDFDFDEEELA